MDWKEIIGLAKDTKQKMYVTEWIIRKFCPNVIVVQEWQFGMETYMIKCDAVEDFLKQHQVIIAYIPKNANKRNGDLGLFDATEVVIKGIIG